MITDEARRLRDMATEMRSQISRLRAIGHGDDKGQYADKLCTAASDLAGRLEKTVGRYQRVAGALSSWAPELVALATFGLGAVAAAWAQGCPGCDPGGRGTGRPHDGQERRPTLEQCRPHRGRADPGPPQRDRCPTPRCPPEHRRRSPPGPSSR